MRIFGFIVLVFRKVSVILMGALVLVICMYIYIYKRRDDFADLHIGETF